MQLLAWWKDLMPYIKVGSGILQHDAEPRRYLVYILLLLSALMLLIFAAVHYAHESYRLATFQLVLGLSFAVFLKMPEKIMPIHIKENMIILGTLLVFLTLLASEGIANTGIYWVPLLPFLIFAMTGIRLGIRWIALFMMGLIGLHLLDRFAIFPSPYGTEEQ